MAINEKKARELNVPMQTLATNLLNFVKLIGEDYSAPENQRDFDGKSAGQWLAKLLWNAIHCIASTLVLPGCTQISNGADTIHVRIVYWNGRYYIEDGQHRWWWATLMFRGGHSIKIPKDCGFKPFSDTAKPFVGMSFCDLPAKYQDAIKNAPVIMDVFDMTGRTPKEFEEVAQYAFYSANCGSSLKKNDKIRNLYHNNPMFVAINDAIATIRSGKDCPARLSTKGLEVYTKINENTLRGMFESMTGWNIQKDQVGVTSNGAMANAEICYVANCKLSQEQADKKVDGMTKIMATAGRICGGGWKPLLYIGMYIMLTRKPEFWTDSKIKQLVSPAKSKEVRELIDVYLAEHIGADADSPTFYERFYDTTHDKSRMVLAADFMEHICLEVLA